MAINISKGRLRPNYRNWLKTDGVIRQEDFSDTYGLKTADPLWMLARQWQMGEFQAENNSRPLLATIQYQEAKVNQLSTTSVDRNGNPEEVKMPLDENTCLEAMIEHIHIPLNWRDRIRIGQQMMSYLSENELNTFANKYPSGKIWLELPRDETEEARKLDPQTRDYIELILENGRVLDGKKIVDWLRIGTGFSESSKIGKAIDRLKDWYRALYGTWEAKDSSAWSPKELNYNFSLEVEKDNKPGISLIAKNYPGGELDWYSFDEVVIHDETAWGRQKSSKEQICTNLEPAGLPKKRLYEFEDGSFNLNQHIFSKSNLLQIFLVEFGMVYNADWFSLSLPLEAGSLAKIKEIKLLDSFGIESSISKEACTWEKDPLASFGAFEITREKVGESGDQLKHNFLFVPPALGEVQQSMPLEEIIFKRDEINNWVVAEMRTVQNGLGIPQSAENLYSILSETEKVDASGDPMDLKIDADPFELMKRLQDNRLAYLPQLVRIDSEARISLVELVRALQVDQDDFRDRLLLSNVIGKLGIVSSNFMSHGNLNVGVRKEIIVNHKGLRKIHISLLKI